MPALFCNQSSKPSKKAGCFGIFYELLEPSYQLRQGQKAGGCSFRHAVLGVCGESSGASLCLCCTSNDSEGLFGHSSPGEECPANTRLYIGSSGGEKTVLGEQAEGTRPPTAHSPGDGWCAGCPHPLPPSLCCPQGSGVLTPVQVLVYAGCV